MAEIVNLGRARKQRQREADAASAAENRVRHGRTLAQKRADALAERQQRARLDNLRITEPEQPT